jgi:hypothetical protein
VNDNHLSTRAAHLFGYLRDPGGLEIGDFDPGEEMNGRLRGEPFDLIADRGHDIAVAWITIAGVIGYRVRVVATPLGGSHHLLYGACSIAQGAVTV